MSHQCLKNSTRVQVSWEIAGSHTQATRQPVARHGRGTPNNTNATAGPHRRRRRLGRGREDEEDAGGCTERHQSQKGMKESSTSSGEHRARHCGDSGWQWQYETHSGSGWQMAPSSAGARCRQSAVGVARRQRPSRSCILITILKVDSENKEYPKRTSTDVIRDSYWKSTPGYGV